MRTKNQTAKAKNGTGVGDEVLGGGSLWSGSLQFWNYPPGLPRSRPDPVPWTAFPGLQTCVKSAFHAGLPVPAAFRPAFRPSGVVFRPSAGPGPFRPAFRRAAAADGPGRVDPGSLPRVIWSRNARRGAALSHCFRASSSSFPLSLPCMVPACCLPSLDPSLDPSLFPSFLPAIYGRIIDLFSLFPSLPMSLIYIYIWECYRERKKQAKKERRVFLPDASRSPQQRFPGPGGIRIRLNTIFRPAPSCGRITAYGHMRRGYSPGRVSGPGSGPGRQQAAGSRRRKKPVPYWGTGPG